MVLIGTSGWTYRSWKGRFYPDDLPSRRYLEFYATTFPTTEVNASFYHLPTRETFGNWARRVPGTFVFAVKANRFITHLKRLSDVEEAWGRFVEHAAALDDHLGPILLQFPPTFRKDTGRLAAFLASAHVPAGRGRLRLVCEFRHESWFVEETFRLLRRHDAVWCIADGSKYPRKDRVTTDVAYVRYHGRGTMFASNYSDEALAKEARLLRRLVRDGLDVYVYFNNDAEGYAVKNAEQLTKLMESAR